MAAHLVEQQVAADREANWLRVGVECFNCGTVKRVLPSQTGLTLDLAITNAADHLACSECGKSNGTLYYFIYARAARRG